MTKVVSLTARLDRLAILGQPPGCRWIGSNCAMYRVVRVGTDESAETHPPATCQHCRRPTFTRVIVLVADDPSRR